MPNTGDSGLPSPRGGAQNSNNANNQPQGAQGGVNIFLPGEPRERGSHPSGLGFGIGSGYSSMNATNSNNIINDSRPGGVLFRSRSGTTALSAAGEGAGFNEEDQILQEGKPDTAPETRKRCVSGAVSRGTATTVIK